MVSLENLMTYPWIARRVAIGEMHLHGWYFDIREGSLLHYNPLSNAFESINANTPYHRGSEG